MEDHRDFIKSLIDLIPSKYYTPTATAEFQNRKYTKYKQPPTEQLKQIKKAARLEKLNPDAFRSTVEIAEAKAMEDQQRAMNLLPHFTIDPRSVPQPSSSEPPNISELKERLHERIQKLQQSRHHTPVSRNQLLQERKQQQQKQQKQQKAMHPPSHVKAERMAVEEAPSRPQEVESIRYSKIADAEGKRPKKDPKVALQQLAHKKAKLETLAMTHPDKVNEVLESEKWKKMMSMAKGEKQQDDANLLKRSIKRMEKQKRKSKEAWNKRATDLSEQEAERQRKRTENIQKRIQEKKDRKMGMKKKKDKKAPAKKARAGFEGKK